MPGDEGGPVARRRGIQSVEIGLRVLEALVTLGEPSTLSLIAERSGLSAPQAHRYLQSLIASNMAQQDAVTGRYDLGAGALRLGLMALTRVEALSIADQEIGEFVRRSGRTVQIAALGPLGPTIVRWKVGRPPVMTSFGVGSVLPILSSATGRVFLGFAQRNQIDHLIARETADAPVPAAEIDRIRQSVRDAGRAGVEGTQIPGLNATAFPILDLQGHAILSATALMPAGAVPPIDERTDDELGEVCRAISERLGWQAD